MLIKSVEVEAAKIHYMICCKIHYQKSCSPPGWTRVLPDFHLTVRLEMNLLSGSWWGRQAWDLSFVDHSEELMDRSKV